MLVPFPPFFPAAGGYRRTGSPAVGAFSRWIGEWSPSAAWGGQGLRLAHLAHLPAGGGGPAFGFHGPGLLPVAAGGRHVSGIPGGDPEGHDREEQEPEGAEVDWETYHQPVLEKEVLEMFGPCSGKLIMDGTLGGGGHTGRLLAGGADVLALDQDPAALEWAARRLEADADHLVTLRANFASFPGILEEAGLGAVLDGILLDLGVSSHQLDTAERGFSFMREGPLDMRMNPDGPVTAADIVNQWAEEDLARIFFEYGDEKASRRVARAIVKHRSSQPIRTTMELAGVVGSVIPKRGPASPATRVFQALRIAVNDEMGVLESALDSAWRWLKPGGRLAVITFHSLEDRIVKRRFRHWSEAEIDRPEWPAPRPNPDYHYRLITRKGITASAEESSRNPRSRSATLRVVERLSQRGN